MPFFSVITSKIFGAAALVLLLIVGWQQFQLRGYRADLAECRVSTMLLGNANKDQAETIDRITRDKAEFEKRAAVAEADKKRLAIAADAKLKATIKRLTDAATVEDSKPASPALRSALGVVRGQ